MTKGEELYLAGALDEAWDVLQEEAKSGQGRAMYLIGQYYVQGHGHILRNPVEGSAWFAKGSELDDLACVGLHFFTKPSEADDRETFLQTISRVESEAAAGGALALAVLSYVYRLGMPPYVGVNAEKGLSYLKKAAELGFWQAENDLGLLYLNGKELEKNETLGAALLEKAASKEIGQSEYHMAFCYMNGIGVEQNPGKGISYYQKSWYHGNGKAAVALGMRYETGNSVRKDEKKAYLLYKKAADAGETEAMAHAGDCLYEGRGARKDRTAALRLYRKSAGAGDAYALTRLGQIAFEKQEWTEAFSCFLHAAKRRFPTAQYLTGLCLIKGLGVAENRENGILWLRQAAQNGSREAAQMLELL